MAPAVFAADANRGEQLARRWCMKCHAVAPGQIRSESRAPSFGGVFRRNLFSRAQLAVFFSLPQPQMPGRRLSLSEAADLAAYIESQAR